MTGRDPPQGAQRSLPTGELPSWSGRAEGCVALSPISGALCYGSDVVGVWGELARTVVLSGGPWTSHHCSSIRWGCAGNASSWPGPRPAESELQGVAWRCVFMPSGAGLLPVLLEFENRYSGVAPG